MPGAIGDETSDAAASRCFPWGVASGEPRSDAVTLWTKLADDRRPARVRWELWDTDDDAVQRTGHADVDVVHRDVGVDVGSGVGSGVGSDVGDGVGSGVGDGVVRVTVAGLAPGRRYRYRFVDGDMTSPVGTTRTLDPGAQRVRIGIASCARLASGSFEPYDGLRRQAPDLVVHLGDYIYEDGGAPRSDRGVPPEPPHECHSYDDYHRRYAQYRSDRSLQRLHAAAPWVLTVDDHEVTDNAHSHHHRPAGAVEPQRIAAATAARARWMPQAEHGNGPTTHDRLVPLGDVGALVLVDTRLAGREPQAGSGPTVIRRRSQATVRRRLLTDAQWDWLTEIVATPRPGWLLIASQVQVSPLRLAWVPRWRPLGVRPIVNADQWDGYPAERRRLIELLDEHDVRRVLLLSGDLHARFVTASRRGHERDDLPTEVHEVTTPSVSAPAFARLVARRLRLPPRVPVERLLEPWLRLMNPHIVDVDLVRHGTTLLDVGVDEIRITAIGASGGAIRRWRLSSGRLARG